MVQVNLYFLEEKRRNINHKLKMFQDKKKEKKMFQDKVGVITII